MATIESATEIRAFHVEVPEEELDDLRRRIAATRWPSKELVSDRSQGIQLATLQELARYWTTDYDWRKAEAKLNALPQFTTEIDGVDIHFIHVKSQHEDALPLIMTHGWPGSVIELLEAVGPLTDPTAHGGSAEDAFHLVLPSTPWVRFFRRADRGRLERRPHRESLGGADVPAGLHPLRGPGRRRRRLGDRPDGPAGARGAARHPHEPARDDSVRRPCAREHRGGTRGPRKRSTRSGRPALVTSWSRARGRRRSVTPCWIHPSRWRPGCSTTTRTPTTRSPTPSSTGSRLGISRRDHILDNITLYWLTGTGASAARSYWENGQAAAHAAASGQAPPPVSLPVGFTTFPGEIWQSPRSWVEAGYPNVTYFHKAERGRALRGLGRAGDLLRRRFAPPSASLRSNGGNHVAQRNP